MTNPEIRNTLTCIKLMVTDLNDLHNNYDIETSFENKARELILDAIKTFNEEQTVWKLSLIPTKYGWRLKYE